MKDRTLSSKAILPLPAEEWPLAELCSTSLLRESLIAALSLIQDHRQQRILLKSHLEQRRGVCRVCLADENPYSGH